MLRAPNASVPSTRPALPLREAAIAGHRHVADSFDVRFAAVPHCV
jgi:hypothetical protein